MLILHFSHGKTSSYKQACLPECVCVVCVVDTVLDMLSSAAPLPPLRRHTDCVTGSRGFLEYDHLPGTQGSYLSAHDHMRKCTHTASKAHAHVLISSLSQKQNRTYSFPYSKITSNLGCQGLKFWKYESLKVKLCNSR